MKVIYSYQRIEGLDTHFSIFLVGPTPRSSDVPSWRSDALYILASLKFDGIVLVPEPFVDFEDQVEWEYEGLENSSLIAAWVPRKMAGMPALTTNVEFGRYVDSGRLLYGRPDDAEHCGYLDWMYKKTTNLDPFNSLETLLARAVLEKTLRK